MTYELIVTEKPSQAKKIAEALADSKPLVKKENAVSYYILTHEKKNIVVVSAVGHIYSLTEKEKSYKYPSYDIEWVPAYKADKNAGYTKKYIDVIKKLAKEATEFTVATDFDVEGEVIGLNMIRYACKQKDAHRMKFSTLTKPDLIKSYQHKKKHLEWGQANAGETRHFLDWIYGINISRALSTAIKKAGLFKQLSSGRVQGPALKLVVDKEKEVRAFIPTPYWQIFYSGQLNSGQENSEQKAAIEAMHQTEKFTDEKEAQAIHAKIKGKNGKIQAIEKRQQQSQPPTPFDLTTLQTESYRSLKIPPKDTLAIAQELYTNGWISYPRTSSQQLPPEIEYENVLKDLQRNNIYKELALEILGMKPLQPNNGKKTDPAHPAIYPTGIMPEFSGQGASRQQKVYDLIVRRFLATFAGPATRETNKLIIDVEAEHFIAKGTRTIEQGWYRYYGKHVKLEEEEIPTAREGQQVKYEKDEIVKKMTQPPKRFTPASLIKELEKRNLGTKATRAAIIDTLHNRGYMAEKTLEATEIGIKTSDILEQYVPDIVKEDLTREFEDEMELIREEKSTKEKVLNKAEGVLNKILTDFQKHEGSVGKALKESLFETQEQENTIGDCPICKKNKLMIRYSPRTKQYFIGCNGYPDCKATFGLPGNGKGAQPTDKFCESCNYPMIKVGSGRGQRIVCFNMNCPLKVKEEKEDLKDPKTKEALAKPCPECGSALVLRKSVYGEFIGCSNFPKCRYTASADGTPNKNKKSSGEQKKATSKKATKKTTKKTSKKTSKKSTKKTRQK